jgi:hypothetical protein
VHVSVCVWGGVGGSAQALANDAQARHVIEPLFDLGKDVRALFRMAVRTICMQRGTEPEREPVSGVCVCVCVCVCMCVCVCACVYVYVLMIIIQAYGRLC